MVKLLSQLFIFEMAPHRLKLSSVVVNWCTKHYLVDPLSNSESECIFSLQQTGYLKRELQYITSFGKATSDILLLCDCLFHTSWLKDFIWLALLDLPS